MIGSRIGARVASFPGVAVGSGVDEISTQGSQTTLTLTLGDSADPVITGGDAFAITAIVNNTGAATANTLSLAVTLDSSLAFVSASGTGWTCAAVGQVVTCTRATLSVGVGPTITINVTTGGSALTASTSGSCTCANAPTATDTETTVVNLVTKDATAGIYFPNSSTEWSNFLTRKGLVAAVPSGLYLLQEASGNAADSIGVATLTASGSGFTYQSTVSGFSRKAIASTDGAAAKLTSTDASLPDISTASFLALLVCLMPTGAPAAARNILSFGGGGSTRCSFELNTTPRLRTLSTTGNIAVFANDPTGANIVRPLGLKCNRTGTVVTGYDDVEKATPTFGATMTGKALTILSNGGGGMAGGWMYMATWFGAAAELSDTNFKALWTALGWSPAWS